MFPSIVPMYDFVYNLKNKECMSDTPRTSSADLDFVIDLDYHELKK